MGSDTANPLFPKTENRFGKDGTTPEAHLGREGWANADPIRKLFKEACKAGGMPDFKPHSLRHMLARIGEQRAASAEDMKAWSQNLGHESMLTTFTSYGQVPAHRQKEVVSRMTQHVT
ncbi:MAG: hypothetical protein H6887_03880 [Hoeflea sp.]|nr:hypothetical protein [Hoeflea sp.]